MSHFTVLVIGDNVDEQLAPYQENNMGDCPREYMAFTDTEDEMLEEYNTGTQTRVVMEDGSYLSPYDEAFRKAGESRFGSNTHEVPAHLEQREVPFKELYATFEEFAEDYHGCGERDPETNRYGYWENPNRKWDWYQVGGRWTGYFKLKPGAIGETGSPGLLTGRAEPGYVDSCRLGDIDFETQRATARAEAAAAYDKYLAVTAEHGVPQDFSFYREKHGEDLDVARKEYWSQASMQALREADLVPWSATVSETYGCGREAYIERDVASVGVTFAVVKDGVWYEKGSMGWWGMVADEKDQNIWNEQFQKLLADLPPETLVTVVDCHI